MRRPEYLGDGVYAHVDDFGGVVLTTGHHDPNLADNTIVLDLDEVLSALERYLIEHRKAIGTPG